MKKSDDKLGRALTAACERKLPGREFAETVMTEIEGGGGLREISARLPRRNRVLLGLAAAAVLGILLGAGVVSFGTGAGSTRADVDAAAGPAVDLPSAASGVRRPRPIVITIDIDGRIWLGGREVPADQLRARLGSSVAMHRDYGDPLSPVVLWGLIRADRSTPWGPVRETIRTCADPSVELRHLYLATAEKRALPIYLPVDRGLTFSRVRLTRYLVTLARGKDTSGTRVMSTIGGTLGAGRAGLAALEAQFRRRPAGDTVVTIDAGSDVPFGDVAGAVDALRRTGIVGIHFKGTPSAQVKARVTDELIDTLAEEVKPDILETRPIEEDGMILKDPVIKDARTSDHNERDR